MHHYWLAAGQRSLRKFIGPFPINDLQTVWVSMIRNQIFTKLDQLHWLPPRHDMVDFNASKRLVVLIFKMHQNRWRNWGSAPDPTSLKLTTFYIQSGEDWKMNLLPILISWLRPLSGWIYIAPKATLLIYKCTKMSLAAGAPPQTPLAAYSDPSDP